MITEKSAKIEVLVVEDSLTQAETLRQILEDAGYSVRTAENGRVALELIVQEKPSLILTDIVMPEMNGYALCRELKADLQTETIPVILLTSLTNPEDVLEGLACGADNFITKPFKEDYLLSHIEQILANRKLLNVERVRIGVEIVFGGKRRFITANQQQMLSLLLSSYEAAARRNSELIEAQEELRSLNDRLEDLVDSRTSELQEQRDFAMTLLNTAQTIILVLDLDGKIVRFNQYFGDLAGYQLEDIRGRDWFEVFLPGESAQASLEVFREAVGGKAISAYVNSITTRNGGQKQIEWFAKTIRGNDGRVNGLLAVGQDITERLKDDRRLRHLNMVLRAVRHIHQLILVEKNSTRLISGVCGLMVEHRGYWGSWIVLTGPDGKITGGTRAGFGQESISSESGFDLSMIPGCCSLFAGINKDSSTSDDSCDTRLIDLGPEKYYCLCIKLTHENRTFGRFGVLVEQKIGIDEEEKELFTETGGDVAFALNSIEQAKAMEAGENRRSQLEAQLRQAQKIEAIGQLAGGVAHDFNNMLQIINANAEMAMMDLDPASRIFKHVHEILTAGERSANLTRQLLAFARKQTIVPQLLDLNETVANILKMLRRLIGENITPHFKPSVHTCPVNMDPAQIDQILANLVVNARDAIEGVGNIIIEVGQTEFSPADEPICPGWQPGRYVLLTVSDDGCGMNPETLTRIFEPFYTTKEVNKGTGLGLATVYGIVTQNKGFINVISEPGKGTTFKIYLPYHSLDEGRAEVEAVTVSLKGGNETILLVEDEPALLRICTHHLETLGYKVLSAERPELALKIAGEYPDKIDLLLTDVVMPQMSGRDLLHKVDKIRPQINCVFMSGFTSDAGVLKEVFEKGLFFLQKPFTKKSLAAKVREALDV